MKIFKALADFISRERKGKKKCIFEKINQRNEFWGWSDDRWNDFITYDDRKIMLQKDLSGKVDQKLLL